MTYCVVLGRWARVGVRVLQEAQAAVILCLCYTSMGSSAKLRMEEVGGMQVAEMAILQY
jgi:hypothetical protein